MLQHILMGVSCVIFCAVQSLSLKQGLITLRQSPKSAKDSGVDIENVEILSVDESDVIAVLGSTGSIGSAVIRRLASQTQTEVRALCRDSKKANKLFGYLDSKNLKIQEVNLIDEDALKHLMSDVSVVISCLGTTAFPTTKWKNGNTPVQVNFKTIIRILNALTWEEKQKKLKQFIYLSSIGVDRRNEAPFNILNAFGVLDSLNFGENEVTSKAMKHDFKYTIVKPGQLVDDSKDARSLTPIEIIEKFLSKKNESNQSVIMKEGDSLIGDLTYRATAEVIVQSLFQKGAVNKSFSVISAPGDFPDQKKWDELFSAIE